MTIEKLWKFFIEICRTRNHANASFHFLADREVWKPNKNTFDNSCSNNFREPPK